MTSYYLNLFFFLLLLWTRFLILWIYLSICVPFHICQMKFQLVPRRLVGFIFHSLFACFPLAFESVKSTRFVQVGLLLHFLAVIWMSKSNLFWKIPKRIPLWFFLSLYISFVCSVSCELDSFTENNFPEIFFKNHSRFWRSLPDYQLLNNPSLLMGNKPTEIFSLSVLFLSIASLSLSVVLDTSLNWPRVHFWILDLQILNRSLKCSIAPKCDCS